MTYNYNRRQIKFMNVFGTNKNNKERKNNKNKENNSNVKGNYKEKL